MRSTLWFGALLIAACSDPTSGRDLDQAREAWRARGLQHYQLNEDVSCFCAPPRSVKIEVRNDAIVGLVNRETGDTLNPANYQGFFYTVDGLFALIEKASSQHAATLEATYDPTDHYPSFINIDYAKNIADDELGVTASALVVLP